MKQEFVCSKNFPIVDTIKGEIRGFLYNEIFNFHGIKYADAKRFQPPCEVDPWNGVKNALSYGYVSPLLGKAEPHSEVMVPHRYWPMDENCQYLNIWTPEINGTKKRPVMVWLHGGGFFAGSSIEQQAYDGNNMSRMGDCVVVTLNHRLNILGYFDLEQYGSKYENSGNAGNADIVAALKWIRDNIENFGGDSQNVILFGQSGGGMKAWMLMNTPAADNLFHKVIIQSGELDNFLDHPDNDSSYLVEEMMKELGIERGDIEKLETLPYSALAAAYQKVNRTVKQSGHYAGGNPIANSFYLGDPRKVGFTDNAKLIPVIIGTVFGEFSFGPNLADKYHIDTEILDDMLHQEYGSYAARLGELFKKAYPDKCLADLLFLDSEFRYPTLDFVRKLTSCTKAGVYNFLFAYEFPFDDGHVAWHCSDIPFVFHNTDLVPIGYQKDVSDLLEERIFGAFMNFARNGKPDYDKLPHWAPCCEKTISTMIFDKDCEVRTNFDDELIRLHYGVADKFIGGKKLTQILY